MENQAIFEALTVIGQELSDKIDSKKTWNPESNKYSRAINPDIVLKLIAKHFTASDTFVVFTIIRMMNSENKIGFKA